MNKQALVGFFTLVGMLVTFGVFYVLSDFGTRASGYEIGVHFDSAAGLHPGAVTYLSGVPVGTVAHTRLLPDFTVDVIVSIKRNVEIPRSSKFIISAPLSGDPTLLIVPPRKPDASLALLPKQVLPLSDQPQGTNPATLEDLLEEGQGEIKKLDRLLDAMTANTPRLMTSLQGTLDNANKLTVKANTAFDGFTRGTSAAAGRLQNAVDRISGNLEDMSSSLNTTVRRNSSRIDALLASLSKASDSLASTVDSLHQLTGDPRLHENVVEATKSLANTTAALAAIAEDIHRVSGSEQTQAQLHDTFARLDASAQKLNDLLGSFGGRSSVPGVDYPATNAVSPAPASAPPASAPPPSSGGQQRSLPPAVQRKLVNLTKNLIDVQVRVGELSKQTTVGPMPLLTSDRGPQTDFNLTVLPQSSTSVFFGANDIGSATTSYNFLGEERFGGLRLGAGILYSRLGLIAAERKGPLGLETRFYDLRNPTLDAYGSAALLPHLEIFGGERDVFRADRRTVFGIQTTLP